MMGTPSRSDEQGRPATSPHAHISALVGAVAPTGTRELRPSRGKLDETDGNEVRPERIIDRKVMDASLQSPDRVELQSTQSQHVRHRANHTPRRGRQGGKNLPARCG